MSGETVVPVLVVVGYLIACILMGLFSLKTSNELGTTKSSADYFLAGRLVSPILSALSYNATVWSALVFMGAVGIYYNLGLGFNIFLLSEMLAVAIFVPVVGKLYWKLANKYDYITPSDLVAHRYGDSNLIRLVVAAIMIVFMLFFMAVQIVGLAYIMETVTGGFLNYTSAVLVIGFILLFYVVLGGFRAVVWTDALQAVMLMIAMIAIFFVVIFKFDLIPLFKGVLELRPALFNAPGPIPAYTPILWITQGLIIGLAFIFMPQLWVRLYAVENEKGLRNIVLFFIGGTFVIFGLGFLFTVAATNLYAGSDIIPDRFILSLLFDSVPSWFAATLLTGAVAASMSTIDSQVLVLSSILTRDIVEKGMKKKIDNPALVGRIFSAVLICFVAAYAFFPPVTLFAVLFDVTYPGLAATIPAVLIGIYWKRASRFGAAISMIVGGLLAIYMVFGLKNYLGIYTGFWTFMIALILFVIGSLLVPDKAEEQVDLVKLAG